ncbi:uncharacterized protein Dvir_GJ13648 [Drosophila virilis]|uniref:TIR domain-containing protein n=1 Tax=Drosophila virilis TaxID=7244 RepID=B4LEI0_DROVI|nr:uncharacterized protein Dvir_GJ13648 [Drosophila virilis]
MVPGVGNAILYFNNKNLTELPNSTLYGYSNLRQLHLANNRLTHISLAQLPANLTYLDVSNNSLKTFDKNVLEFLSSRSGNIRLRISGNLWICDCDAEPLISFVANLSNSIDDPCILKSIEESKRIIILMTKNFKQSAWGRFEFRMAVQATSIDQYKRLIIIVYPEVEDFNDLDSELRTYMKLNTYLRRDDPQFWRKLIFAMPHNHGNHGRAPINAERQAQELPLLRPKTVA